MSATGVGGRSAARLPVAGVQRVRMPTWPFTITFAGFPLWWLLGVVDFIWIPMAAAMVYYMVRSRTARVPHGFGVWLLFLVWIGISVIGLTEASQLLAFGYRYAIYLACTAFFVYVFNNGRALTDRFTCGVLTVWWLITVAGGYIALALPTAVFRTPLSYVLPGSLVNNPWINQMVIRRLNQYNPDSYFQLDPRPSAPFLYTNNWGNVYSLLIPFVIVYLLKVRGTKRFWFLLVMIPASFVPAILTTNKGMFLALGLAALYISVRLMLRRDLRGVIALAVVAVVAVGVFQVLPVADRLQSRNDAPSTVDRASLYLQSLQAVQESPFFGYGRTIEGTDAVDPVGTQGQFWMVLVSHGIVPAVLFLLCFVLAYFSSLRRTDSTGLAANTVLIVGTIEFFYYGALPYGLPIMAIAAALALRSPEKLHTFKEAP